MIATNKPKRQRIVPLVISPQVVSFVALVAQNVSLVLLIRTSRLRASSAAAESSSSSRAYNPSTVVLVTEVAKLMLNSTLECYFRSGSSSSPLLRQWLNRDDLMRMTFPALLYVLQNNLMYVALANLSVPLFQVTNQGKIAATAFFGYLFMGRSLSGRRIASLFLLGFGIVVAQLAAAETKAGNDASSSTSSVKATDQSQWVGLIAMIVSSLTSGLAGVYFEWMLKRKEIVKEVPKEETKTLANEINEETEDKEEEVVVKKKSVYLRNMQLALPSIVLSGLPLVRRQQTMATGSKATVASAVHSFFAGYDWLVWVIVANQALSGLLVSMVMKHADSTVKVLAISLSVILSSILSEFVVGEAPAGGVMFWIGATMVVSACLLYYYSPSGTDHEPSAGVTGAGSFWSRLSYLLRKRRRGLMFGLTLVAIGLSSRMLIPLHSSFMQIPLQHEVLTYRTVGNETRKLDG